MSYETLLKLRMLSKEADHTMAILIDEVESKMLSPNDGVSLDDGDSLSMLINKKRKLLGVTLENLALQTDISISTLKRLFLIPAVGYSRMWLACSRRYEVMGRKVVEKLSQQPPKNKDIVTAKIARSFMPPERKEQVINCFNHRLAYLPV